MIVQSPTTMKMASTSAVQSWLGQELETRGVDAVVYTRYILSILQQDSFELEPDQELAFVPFTSGTTKGVGGSGYPGSTSARKEKSRGRWKGRCQKWQNPEDLKKDAVLKCLQSITEKDCGIEGLVEELCLKLKKVQEEREDNACQSTDVDSKTNRGSSGNETERYYEAFPALSDKTNLIAADVQPKGAWSAKSFRQTSSSDASSPTGEHELEKLPSKSVSACVSRNSSSPVGFQGRQYQRAQSLPSSLSRNQSKNPSFVVPKYQGRRGHRTYSHGHERGIKRQNRDRDWNSRGGEKGDTKHRSGGSKKGNCFPEWYRNSATDGPTAVRLTRWDIGEAGKIEGTHATVLQLEGIENGDSIVKEEARLEEAVSTMAESLCRSIMDECEDDHAYGDSTSHQASKGDNEMYMFGSGDSMKEWYAGSTRIADFDTEAGMAPIVAEGQCNPSSSIWEKNLVPGSPLGTGQQEPWGYIARSCLPTTTNMTATTTTAATYHQHVSSPATPNSVPEDSGGDETSETTSLVEELQVVIDHHHLESAPISPRNAPIGTGRNTDSLLRICDHTHAHSHAYNPNSPSTQAGAAWGIQSEGSHGALHSTPVLSCLTSDHSFSTDEDSLVQGICSSQKESSNLLSSMPSDAHSLDMNSVLWATYEAKHTQVHPPKIVTWDDSIFAGFQPLAKASAFIEGGVYGSPYSSQNNSRFNSCSTSPCNDSSIRELWEGSQGREPSSSVCSLDCLLSPQPLGAPGGAVQDEQSIIEDSLVDSPKYLCSRSSSRFDFARDVGEYDNSDNSSPAGTETDEMISEDELVEEVPKDSQEASAIAYNLEVKCNTKDHSENCTPQDKGLVGSSETGGGSVNSQQGSANSQQGLHGALLGSGEGTVVSQHLLSADWNKDESSSISRPEPIRAQPVTAGCKTSLGVTPDKPFESPNSHFQPIQGAATLVSKDQPSLSTQSVQYAGKDCLSTNPGSVVMPEDTLIATGHASGVSNPWMSAQTFVPQPGQSSAKMPAHPSEKTFQSDSRIKNSSGGGLSGLDCVSKAPLQTTDLFIPNMGLIQQSGGYGGFASSSLLGGARNHYNDTGGSSSALAGGDPGGGGGGGGYFEDTWSYFGVRPGMPLDYEPPPFPDEDDVFFQEGLLVDQPLELQSSKHHGRNKRRSQTSSICRDFVEGRCQNSTCRLSHDVSRLTCRQWQESQCPRGSQCQFMHGYTSDISSQSSSCAASRNGSTTPDETEEVSWDDGRRLQPRASEMMLLPGYQRSGDDDSNLANSRGRGGGGGGGDHMRSLPINIASKTR